MHSNPHRTFYKIGTDPEGRGIIASFIEEDYDHPLRIIDGKVFRINYDTGEFDILFDANPNIVDNSALPVTPPTFPSLHKQQWQERFRNDPNIVSKCPYGSGLKAGQKVVFTNVYGVRFGPHKILGFAASNPAGADGRYIYLDYDCYWFPTFRRRIQSVDKDTSAS